MDIASDPNPVRALPKGYYEDLMRALRFGADDSFVSTTAAMVDTYAGKVAAGEDTLRKYTTHDRKPPTPEDAENWRAAVAETEALIIEDRRQLAGYRLALDLLRK
jgi:hypothetical protein